jgi:enterochelin esterase-like enzyme
MKLFRKVLILRIHSCQKAVSLFILFACAAFTLQTHAQWGRRPLISPDITDDHSVIFRLYAPDARSVKLSGNWMQGWGASVEMERNDTGLFQTTIDPLAPEIYTYTFIIDGVRVLDPGNFNIVRDGVRNESVFTIRGEGSDVYNVFTVPHGTVSKVWYPSPTLGMDRRIYIYTPPGYYTSDESYPVLYLFHGAGGDEDAWTTLGRTNYIMDNLIAAGKAVPMIVVMTNGVPTMAAAPADQPVDLEINRINSGGPGGMVSGKFEESLVKDVIPFVEKNFRVIADADYRAISGLSMGGFHTQMITNANPGMFNYVGVMSMGLFNDPRLGNYNKEDHIAQIKALKDSGVKLYWIACGKDDFLYESVTNLRKFYDDLGLEYVYRESAGGHTWPNWRIYLSEFVPMLFK